MTTLAEDYSPPSPWMSFDIRMRSGDQRRFKVSAMETFDGYRLPAMGKRHQSTVAGLEDAELYWVQRVVTAEIKKREQAELVRRVREET